VLVCAWQGLYQGLPVLTVGTSMAVTFTHVFLWGSSATNPIENALMGSPWFVLLEIDRRHHISIFVHPRHNYIELYSKYLRLMNWNFY
jgi:hypothetical protein